MMSHIAESKINTYTITAPTGRPAPKIAVTKFQLNMPTSPQFIAPISTKTEAIMFAITILLPSYTDILCKIHYIIKNR